MIFVQSTAASRPPGLEHNSAVPSNNVTSTPQSLSVSSSRQQQAVTEDEVDQYLEKQDGRIQRTRSEQLYKVHWRLNKAML